jgi:twinkle protein
VPFDPPHWRPQARNIQDARLFAISGDRHPRPRQVEPGQRDLLPAGLAARLDTGFASFEQRPQDDHRRALRSFHGRQAEAAMTMQQLAAADDWIDQRFSFLVANDEEDVDLAWVLERAAAAVRRFAVDVLVIDPWNEMDHLRPAGMSLTEYTGYAIKQFKKFARRHRVHLIVVAHPAKLQRIQGSGKYPVPTLYDIADSAHWANKPDIGLVVHRESLGPEGTTMIKVPKVRYCGEIGMPGEVTGLRRNREVTRYEAQQ